MGNFQDLSKKKVGERLCMAASPRRNKLTDNLN